MKLTRTFFFSFLVAALISCHDHPQRKVSRAYYFWRTVFDLSSADQEALHTQGIGRLYTRFFDVGPGEIKGKPTPVQDIHFVTEPDSLLDIVPVVFVVNESLLHLSDSSSGQLGRLIAGRVLQIEKSLRSQHLREIQLDCDWTESTRNAYFSLLLAVKDEVRSSGILVSATIRLHQIKYFQRTGVPPVDRGMLMFYNMGKLQGAETANSIYDPKTAQPYLRSIPGYPLELDVVLPCFSWVVVLHNGHVSRLITQTREPLPLAALEQVNKSLYKVKNQVTAWDGVLYPGEFVRLEKAGLAECDKAAVQLEPFLKKSGLHVAVYHLKANQLNAYEKDSLETVYHRFD